LLLFGYPPRVRASLAALGLLILAAFPGVLLADVLLSTRPSFERRVVGLVSGFGLLLIASFVCTSLHVPMLALLLMAGAAIVAGRLWIQRASPSAPSLPVGPGGWTAMAVVLAAAFAWFAIPVWLRVLPQGWDPAFHVSAIELIRTEQHIPDTWAPFEPFEKFNYPPALHSVLALYARLADLPSDRVFTLALLGAGALNLVMVLLLGWRVGGQLAAGLLAVIVYGFTDGWGTLASHASWGGLANLTSLLFMWAILLTCLEPGRGPRIATTLLAVAMVVLHHLSFAIAGFTIFFIAGLEWLAERRWSEPVRTALWATGVAVVSAGVLVLTRPSGRFSVAEAFHFDREAMITLPRMVEAVGWPVMLLGGIGLVLALMSRLDPPMRMLAGWTVGLLAFWVTWDIVYRTGAWALTHQVFTAFTPSRGLTDAAVLLAVMGGVLLWRILREWPHPPVWIGAFLLVAVAYGWDAENGRVNGARNAAFSAERARAFCAEVRRTTPEDAVVLAKDFGEVDVWLPYLCERELNYFPDPGYATSPYRDAKMRERDPEAFARVVRRERPRPIYFATRRTFNGGRLIFTLGDWRLYEVPS
jgi:hypothetical protein